MVIEVHNSQKETVKRSKTTVQASDMLGEGFLPTGGWNAQIQALVATGRMQSSPSTETCESMTPHVSMQYLVKGLTLLGLSM
jgi:hypothetical protein